MSNSKAAQDGKIIRDLARRYAELAADPVQERRRELWRQHYTLRDAEVPVLVRFGMWNVWCKEVFGESTLECQDPFLRHYERMLRMQLFHGGIGDDYIFEPWISVGAVHRAPGDGLWGVEEGRHTSDVEGGAWRFDPPLKEWTDMAKLRAPIHDIDRDASARNVARLQDVLGDILVVDAHRGPRCTNFHADISTHLARLRGLEQMMLDMFEAPEELHRLLAFMRDGILANQQGAEDAGDWSLVCHENQAMAYSTELVQPRANSHGVRRNDLWGFCAAQEYTLVSPAMHDEFLLQYQLPIMKNFAMIHYGCCEDLTRKIDMLRQIPNLRSVAVTPVADVAACAAQIRGDYAVSWRPNPTDMVAYSFNPARIREIIGNGLRALDAAGCHPHILLKDIETVGGDPGRLAAWTRVVRETVSQVRS